MEQDIAIREHRVASCHSDAPRGHSTDPALVGILGLSRSAPLAFLTSDANGRITFANTAADTLFGFPPNGMIGENVDVIIPERFRAGHEAGMARMVRGAQSKLVGRTMEVTARRCDGSEFPAEFTLSMWQDEQGFGFGAILRDISEWRERDARLVQLAHHDALTGLMNRAAFEEDLQASLATGDGAAVLMLDLDGFKEVNDSWGHATGDAVLQTLALRIPGWLDVGARLARFGGDEFAVLMPGVTDPMRLAAQAVALLDAFTPPLAVETRIFHLGVSIGGAITPVNGTSTTELIGDADLALFRAKQDGKRRFRLFEPVMRSFLLSRLALRDDLRRAAKNGEFILHYQPQVTLGTGAIVGVEALLRWQHPVQGLLLPGAFLTQLEEHPLALDVGCWILDEACRQTAEWRAAGLPPIRMGVNLFTAQVRSGTLAKEVKAALERHQLPPDALELEITETIALRADESTVSPFAELRRAGVGVAFDDFGTGYAALSSLKRFPLTRLKIDRGFVRDLLGDVYDTAITRAIVQIGRDVGLEVIAEGIETVAQEAVLIEIGCPQGQGYRYGKAMPPQAITALLAPGGASEQKVLRRQAG